MNKHACFRPLLSLACEVDSERTFIQRRRLDLTQAMEAARPVARPLMNSSLRVEAGPSGITPALSQKEHEKVAALEKLTNKRKFAAQQLASLRPEDRLPEEDYQKMAEQLGRVSQSVLCY